MEESTESEFIKMLEDIAEDLSLKHGLILSISDGPGQRVLKSGNQIILTIQEYISRHGKRTIDASFNIEDEPVVSAHLREYGEKFPLSYVNYFY